MGREKKNNRQIRFLEIYHNTSALDWVKVKPNTVIDFGFQLKPAIIQIQLETFRTRVGNYYL